MTSVTGVTEILGQSVVVFSCELSAGGKSQHAAGNRPVGDGQSGTAQFLGRNRHFTMAGAFAQLRRAGSRTHPPHQHLHARGFGKRRR